MPEEVLYFTFIAMVTVIMINIVCMINHIHAERRYDHFVKLYDKMIYEREKYLWKEQGAYEAPEGNKLYLDLEGIRLVIFEGKIEGWYKP